MTWLDQQRLADVLLVEEIVAVARDGGETLIREKLAALSEGERRVLREALA